MTRTVSTPAGAAMPVLGLGTWRLGEAANRRTAEVAAVRSAIGMGYRLIDTAEMYGDGGSEEVVGEAIAQAIRAGEVQRDELFIVSKVLPQNASRKGTAQACARSLARLGLDRIDLYLLHWQGPHPLRETCAALQALVAQGDIGQWGVSNFDIDDMAELNALGEGKGCAANQVYYSLGERGPEFGLLPWLRDHGQPLMAYSPIDRGALASDARLEALAARRGVTVAQLALGRLLAESGVVAIPKAVRERHLRENLAAAALVLTPEEIVEIDRLYPPPRRKTPLAMI
ncbi:aldo/keto reductase [Variovorax humicola]|uniref:Aldo/keto reductase n=1 Tax=Variovorax humicola TaxID=1769758 RepID=A0ABU8W6U8_9BURK